MSRKTENCKGFRKLFTQEERRLIEDKLKAGWDYSQIAQLVGRTRRTIRQEIKNRSYQNKDGILIYEAWYAQEDYKRKTKKQKTHHQRIFTDEEKEEIEKLVKAGYSVSSIRRRLGGGYECMKKFIFKHFPDVKVDVFVGVQMRIESIEMQLEIILDVIRRIENGANKT